MRLTLRTMLAYLDDILEPDDSVDIRRKIDESEFATRLVQRVREGIRRVRLAAPPVVGRGMGLDPNTVAEYLDNTLASERVPEFEKVCLESDVHLAEVASCHQILTLVLGEPAAIEPESRERMYKLLAQADSEEAAAEASAVAAETPSSVRPPAMPAPPPRPKPEIPDYLREPKSRLWPVAATILIAALLTVGILAFVGPWRIGNIAAVGDHQNEGGDPMPQPGPNPASQPSGPVKQAPVPPVNTGAGVPVEPAQPKPGQVPAAPPDTRAVVQPDLPLPPEPGKTAAAVPLLPPDSGKTQLAAPGTRVGEGDPEQPPADASALPGGEPKLPARQQPSAEAFGRYLSDHEILLKFDQASGWIRLAPTAPLSSGDRLIALPGFRPTLTLASGISVQLMGPSLVLLEGLDGQGVPTLNVRYGRLLLLTIGKANNMLKLRVGDGDALLTFIDPSATAAIEVRQVLVPGKDPAVVPAAFAAELYATRGEIGWKAEDTSILQGPARKLLTQLALPESEASGLPKWIAVNTRSGTDQRAADTLERDLRPDQPVDITLKELTDDRRIEVRSLSIRSSALIGQLEPLATALKNEDHRAAWTGYAEVLQQVMAQSPDVAKQVHTVLVKLRGPDGDDLYEMLCGYTADQLKQGAAAKLVGGLSHDSLDVRVLSFWNLQNITGMNQNYRPEHPPAKRRTAVQKWTEKLRDGKIQFPPPSSS